MGVCQPRRYADAVQRMGLSAIFVADGVTPIFMNRRNVYDVLLHLRNAIVTAIGRHLT